MKEKNERKVRDIIERLESRGHYVKLYSNGHIKVAGVDFWCTSEKWYDAKTQEKGEGLKSFTDHIEKVR